MKPIDVAIARAATPGCEHVLHFNNAGSSLPTTQTLDAQVKYLTRESTMGGYEAMAASADDMQLFYDGAAALINATSSEIAYQSGASEAWWRAFLSVPLKPGDRVLAGTTEFQTAAVGLIQARERGIVVDRIPDDASGQTDIDALASMLERPTKLVCLTQIGMSNGLVNPAEEVGSLTKDAGAIFLLDACQAVGQMPIDVDVLRCDFLTATGRKWLRGPRGSGFLYVRTSTLEQLDDPVFVDGRSALWDRADGYMPVEGAQRFEFAETYPAGRVGLGAAIAQAQELGLDAIQSRIRHLATRLRAQLADISGLTVTDRGAEQCGIVSFTTHGIHGFDLRDALGALDINVSSPPPRNSRWMFESIGIDSVVRASPHYYNTEAEIAQFTEAVARILTEAG